MCNAQGLRDFEFVVRRVTGDACCIDARCELHIVLDFRGMK